MISCGVDIAMISELRMLLDTDKMSASIYHPQELAVCVDWARSRRDEFLAGRFCAKEAIFKAVNTISGRYRQIRLNRIIVLRSPQWQPIVHLEVGDLNAPPVEVTVSISHKENHVIAFSIAQEQTHA